jgi:hypothetical protein
MNDIRTMPRRRLRGCLSGVVRQGLMRMRSVFDSREICFWLARMLVLHVMRNSLYFTLQVVLRLLAGVEWAVHPSMMARPRRGI